jgi:pimeloyl-ACP methyl ester carboxylesterase
MADFVLMHGTTQGPEGWSRLTAALESRGHRCVAVDLALTGDRSIRELEEAVVSQVPSEIETPVLVAHSGTGPILPGAATLLNASHQVWLAAIVPDGQRGLLEEIRSAPTEVFNPEWLGKDPTSDPVLAAYFLFHDCNLETLQWGLTTLRLFAPSSLYADPVPLAPKIPSTYVVAAQDRTLRPEWCRRAASTRLSAALVTIDSGHCPHVSHPDEVAGVLESVATSS